MMVTCLFTSVSFAECKLSLGCMIFHKDIIQSTLQNAQEAGE